MTKAMYHLFIGVSMIVFVLGTGCHPRSASESELRYMEAHPAEYPVLQMINEACEVLSTRLQTEGLPGLQKNTRVTMIPEKTEVMGKRYTIPIRFSFAGTPAYSPEDSMRDAITEQERERKEVGWEKQVEIKGRKKKVNFPFKLTVKVMRKVEPGAYYIYTMIKQTKDAPWTLAEAYKTDRKGKVLRYLDHDE